MIDQLTKKQHFVTKPLDLWRGAAKVVSVAGRKEKGVIDRYRPEADVGKA